MGCTGGESCAVVLQMRSAAEGRRYGLFLTAPDQPACDGVRFRVESARAEVVGSSPPVAAGQAILLRMPHGFAAGVHDLTVRMQGCGHAPVGVRRVALGRASPDHSWRAVLPVIRPRGETRAASLRP